MSDSKNPYTAPESNVNNNLQARSSIPKVIGIISIILGTLGLITGLMTLGGSFFASEALDSLQTSGAAIPGLDKSYLLISSIITLVTSIWAIFIGFKLLKYFDLGRRHFNYYTIVTIIISIGTFFYTKDMMDQMFADMPSDVANAAGGIATLGSMGAFIAPIILIIVALLLNQKNVKDSLI